MKVDIEFKEPDRKKKIKRTIAREGLVIIGIFFCGVFLYTQIDNFTATSIGMFFMILGVPVYLLIRFIIWAIKALKK